MRNYRFLINASGQNIFKNPKTKKKNVGRVDQNKKDIKNSHSCKESELNKSEIHFLI